MKFYEIMGENFVVYIVEPDDVCSEQGSLRTQAQQVGAWNIIWLNAKYFSQVLIYYQIETFKFYFMKNQPNFQ